MMTFKEFLNRKDQPMTALVSPPSGGGLQVVRDLSQDLKPKSLQAPTVSSPRTPAMPTMMGGRLASAKPIPKKPTDFLARRGSSFRKDF